MTHIGTQHQGSATPLPSPLNHHMCCSFELTGFRQNFWLHREVLGQGENDLSLTAVGTGFARTSPVVFHDFPRPFAESFSMYDA